MKIRTLSILIVSAFFVLLAGTAEVQAAGLPAPTMIAPASGMYTTDQSPTITGVATSGTRIAVYIDEVYYGDAWTVSDANGVQSFAYTPFLQLSPGLHTVKARAIDELGGTQSNVSLSHTFTVEHRLPEPTVIGKIVNTDSSLRQPWIVGVAPSGSEVDVWIDGIHQGKTTASMHASGTGDFKIRAKSYLYIGSHAVTSTARVYRADGSARLSEQAAATKIVISAPATTVLAPTPAPVDDSTEETEAEETSAKESTDEVVEETTEETTEEITEEESTEEVSDESLEVQSEPSEELEFVEDGDTGGNLDEADSEEESADENEEFSDEEGDNEDSAEDKDETGDKNDDEEGEDNAANEESGGALSFVGWALLIIVAIIVVSRMRKGSGNEPTQEISFGPSSDSSDSSNKSDSGQSQLDLKADDGENKNIEVIKNNDSKSDNK